MSDMIAKAPMDRRIADIIRPTVEGMGYVPVRVRLMGGKRVTLQIMAERPDGGMEVEDCAKLSRALSAALDVEDLIEREYTLEVSSPGIDRPLTRLADFNTYAGRVVKLQTDELIGGRKRFSGVLLGTLGGEVRIRIEGVESGPEDVALPFEALSDAKLMLTDELIAESLRRQANRAFEENEFDDIEPDDIGRDGEAPDEGPAGEREDA